MTHSADWVCVSSSVSACEICGQLADMPLRVLNGRRAEPYGKISARMLIKKNLILAVSPESKQG